MARRVRQLTASGLLEPDADGYGTLHLTEAARPVLQGTQAVRMRHEANQAERRAARRSSRGSAASRRQSLDIAPHEEPLWQALRDTRARLAREQGVPAYVIFHDATLLAMLRERPATRSDMAAISGVGERKLERYGEAFLETLQAAEPA